MIGPIAVNARIDSFQLVYRLITNPPTWGGEGVCV